MQNCCFRLAAYYFYFKGCILRVDKSSLLLQKYKRATQMKLHKVV